jgi:broad specificity phosphatase PhoE
VPNSINVTINSNGKLETINLPKKLCLIRHCQSLMNYLSDEANLYQNPLLMDIFIGNHHWDYDIQLSATGLQQAELLGKYWQENEYDKIYPYCVSSNFTRCNQTAKHIKQYFSSDSAYKEKGSGALFARPLYRLEELIPNYKELNKDKWNFDGGESESFKNLYSRLFKALSELSEVNTVIVTHSDVITTFKHMFESEENQTFNDYLKTINQYDYPQNGEIIEYDFEQGTVTKTKIIDDYLESNYATSKPQNLTFAKFYVK